MKKKLIIALLAILGAAAYIEMSSVAEAAVTPVRPVKPKRG